MALADLPSKEVLQSKLLGLLLAPASTLVRLINTPASQVAQVLKAYSDKGEPIGTGLAAEPAKRKPRRRKRRLPRRKRTGAGNGSGCGSSTGGRSGTGRRSSSFNHGGNRVTIWFRFGWDLTRATVKTEMSS